MSIVIHQPTRRRRGGCTTPAASQPVAYLIAYRTPCGDQLTLAVQVHSGPLTAEGAERVLSRAVPGAQVVSVQMAESERSSVLDSVDDTVAALTGSDTPWASAAIMFVGVIFMIMAGTEFATRQVEIWHWTSHLLGIR